MAKGHGYNYHQGNSVQELSRELPAQTVRNLARKMDRLAITHGLTYTDERGKTAVINLTLRPRIICAAIERPLWHTIQALDRAFQKVANFYFHDPSLYELFPFSERERQWLELMQLPGYIPGPLATRWDANTTFADQEWEEGFCFFEVNGVGVGGMWYGPQAAEVALKTVVPELRKRDPRFRPCRNPSMSLLLLDLIQSQRKKLNRRRGVIALTMERASGSNFIEFERLARLYQRLGHSTIVVEPTELWLKGGEVWAKGKKIDLIYRDTTLSELCSMEASGYDMRGLREAFLRGQVISSLEGEFDHKSVFEVFTSPQYESAFTQREWALFKRHILWTRLFKERKTTDPSGRPIDLVPYVRKTKDRLVLKPNRLYGGKGIIFGSEVNSSAWHKKITRALLEPGEWVIQKLGKLRKKSFFSPRERKIKEKHYYVVSGFFATEKGLGIVGRMSEKTVVNVAQRGGLTPILLMK